MSLPMPQRPQSAAALGDQQQQAAFAAPYNWSPDALSFDFGGMAAFVVPPAPIASAAEDALPLQHASTHASRDGAAAGSTPSSPPLQHLAGSQSFTQPGDSSGVAARVTTGIGSKLGGSRKPAVKHKAQKAWRNRQKVQAV
jgi:hypothetical protein